MSHFSLFRILTFLVTLIAAAFPSMSSAQADTANPPRIQSIEILNSKIFSPGDVMQIKVNYSGGNPGLAAIIVSGDCLRSSYAYEYGWIKGRSQMEFFTFFQYLNEPQSPSDQIINAVVSNYCQDGVKNLYVTIEDETRLSDDSRQRGIQKTFTVQGGHLIAPGNVLPEKQTDTIDISGIPSTLIFDGGQKNSYPLPRSSKNGQIVWWTAQGDCKVYVPFFLDAGGSLIPTKQGSCVLQAYLFPVDKYFSPELKANVTFSKNNNWDYPKVGAFKVLAAGQGKAAAEKASLVKKTTITCSKGKLIKKVTGVKPTCPVGYKKK
jgi:hypothetical protein